MQVNNIYNLRYSLSVDFTGLSKEGHVTPLDSLAHVRSDHHVHLRDPVNRAGDRTVMAHGGFPWTAQVNDGAKHSLNGVQGPALQGDAPGKPMGDVTNSNRNMSGTTVDDEKASLSKQAKGRAKLTPIASNGKSMAFSTPAQQLSDKAHSRLPVRTIPPWVQSAREEDLISGEDGISFPDDPSAALVAQHNHSPAAARNPHLHALHRSSKEGYPLSSGHTRSQPTSRWITFARASAYPKEDFNDEKVDHEWLNEHFGDYSQPWLANHNEDDIEDGSSRYHAFRKKRQAWYKRSQHTILRNPFIPLVFRLIVFIFAMTALALGGSIHHITDRYNDIHPPNQGIKQGPSTMMAIIVDAVALVYIVYVTYDEYFNKPLGLRSARAKIRIVLLDLFFIVFQAANLSLAFQGLSDTSEGCKSDPGGPPGSEGNVDSSICERQRALASVLFIALIAWLMTFSVSVLRLVERINTK